MSEQASDQRTYPYGVPCWVDIEPADPDAAAVFYGGLFGWTFQDAMPPGASGFYLIASLDGQDAAAIGPVSQTLSGTPAWNTYIAADDADAAAAAVTAAGGTVTEAPQDAGPGDRAGVLPFYSAVFGWEANVPADGSGAMMRVPGYGDHLAATIDPGIRERHASAPPGFSDAIGGLDVAADGEPSHWHVFFTVADRDESATTAERLGASVLSVSESMWTRNALIRDPQGAELTLSQFTPPG